MTTATLTTLGELHKLASDVNAAFSEGERATVCTLTGDLGAGKTAFTKELAKCLGIADEVTSPTFVIMKGYNIPTHAFFKKLIHIDAYRIEEEEEMRVLGFAELLADPENLIVIEWPERISGLIPKDAHCLTFVLQGDTRTITYDRDH